MMINLLTKIIIKFKQAKQKSLIIDDDKLISKNYETKIFLKKLFYQCRSYIL